jgi:hypothetical protein
VIIFNEMDPSLFDIKHKALNTFNDAMSNPLLSAAGFILASKSIKFRELGATLFNIHSISECCATKGSWM